MVDKIVDQRGTRAVAEAYLKGLYSPEAQDLVGQLHYRPRDLDALKKYSADLPNIPFFTIDETFGGWVKAQTTFFADGGDVRPDLQAREISRIARPLVRGRAPTQDFSWPSLARHPGLFD